MIINIRRQKSYFGFQSVVFLLVTAFTFSLFAPYSVAMAEDFGNLPKPGVMIKASQPFALPVLAGIKVSPVNPLQFDFLIEPGDKALPQDEKQAEYLKLVKYFMASLTTAEKDMWVNLSPYEGKRIIPTNFGQTEMGRDLLAQDYILKQLTASLIYPEDELGKKFWNKVYHDAQTKYGTTNIPVNTFNKVWIIPDKATVFEKGNVAMVVDAHMKVMLEQDYLALNRHANVNPNAKDVNAVGSQVVREIVLPALDREVNTGAHFAQLRQIYNSMVLAAWFKKRLKENILRKVYADRNKVMGIELVDKQDNQKIYERYLQAYKKGVYNYIKEEVDPMTGGTIPRKYFSGGFFGAYLGRSLAMTSDTAMARKAVSRYAQMDEAMINLEEINTLVNPSKRLGTWGASPDGQMNLINFLMRHYAQKMQQENRMAGQIRLDSRQLAIRVLSVLSYRSLPAGMSIAESDDFAHALYTRLYSQASIEVDPVMRGAYRTLALWIFHIAARMGKFTPIENILPGLLTYGQIFDTYTKTGKFFNYKNNPEAQYIVVNTGLNERSDERQENMIIKEIYYSMFYSIFPELSTTAMLKRAGGEVIKVGKKVVKHTVISIAVLNSPQPVFTSEQMEKLAQLLEKVVPLVNIRGEQQTGLTVKDLEPVMEAQDAQYLEPLLPALRDGFNEHPKEKPSVNAKFKMGLLAIAFLLGLLFYESIKEKDTNIDHTPAAPSTSPAPTGPTVIDRIVQVFYNDDAFTDAQKQQIRDARTRIDDQKNQLEAAKKDLVAAQEQLARDRQAWEELKLHPPSLTMAEGQSAKAEEDKKIAEAKVHKAELTVVQAELKVQEDQRISANGQELFLVNTITIIREKIQFIHQQNKESNADLLKRMENELADAQAALDQLREDIKVLNTSISLTEKEYWDKRINIILDKIMDGIETKTSLADVQAAREDIKLARFNRQLQLSIASPFNAVVKNFRIIKSQGNVPIVKENTNHPVTVSPRIDDLTPFEEILTFAEAVITGNADRETHIHNIVGQVTDADRQQQGFDEELPGKFAGFQWDEQHGAIHQANLNELKQKAAAFRVSHPNNPMVVPQVAVEQASVKVLSPNALRELMVDDTLKIRMDDSIQYAFQNRDHPWQADLDHVQKNINQVRDNFSSMGDAVKAAQDVVDAMREYMGANRSLADYYQLFGQGSFSTSEYAKRKDHVRATEFRLNRDYEIYRKDYQTSVEQGIKHSAPNAPNHAMLPYGGIDFDAQYLQMNIQGDAAMTIPIPNGFEWLATQPVNGFTPHILEINSGTTQTLSFFKGVLS